MRLNTSVSSVSNLLGGALAWATPLVNTNNQIPDSYPAFVNSLQAMFTRKALTITSQEHLLDIRQGAQDTVPRPPNLKEMIALVLQIDFRLQEYSAEKRKGQN